MKRHIAHAICTVAALALATLLAGQAHADCSGSQRISHEEAECLEASWNNNVDALSNGIVSVTNECASYGTVGAKIELNSCTAIYRTLSTGKEHQIWTVTCDVEEVSCCKDRGDLCNISDVVNADSCLDQFSKSSASETCSQVSASIPSPITGGDGSGQCDISADCQYTHPQTGTTLHKGTDMTADWVQVPDLRNCDGELRLGAC